MSETETIIGIREKLHDGFPTPVYVHFTTWKKRDKYVPEMLSYFSKQTFKPTRIVCWLSILEYRHRIPLSIQECLDRHLLDEVRWVRGNTYCHKRWEAFKYFGDGYNLMIDDDIYYSPDHIETLLAHSLAYPGAVVCYYGWRSIYSHGVWGREPFRLEPSLQNEQYSGACCFPPGLFPEEALRHRWKRTLYCRRCDDSWVKAWLVKSGIPLLGCKEWHNGCYHVIDNTQSVGIWETVSSMTYHGVLRKYQMLCDALYHIGAVEEGERVWPDMEIARYRSTPRTRLLMSLPYEMRHRILGILKGRRT